MSGKHTHIVPGTWRISCSFHSVVAILVAVFIILVFYKTRENKLLVGENGYQMTMEHKMPREVNKDGSGDSLPGCNLFSGKWVYDDKSFPLYKEQDCSFIDDGMACERFGRKDLNYQHWRWKPHDCDLPRFNATAMLEELRGKRIVFVGDSLNRNQWASMVCLVQSSIPPSLKSTNINGSLITFKAIEYNASIDFYWAPLLVESNSDDLINHRIPNRIIRVQAIEKHARHWTNADILVFNSYIWWRRPKLQVLWGSFGSSDGIYKEVEMLRSYEMALRTWSDWLDIHINGSKTKLFFTSMSPTHTSLTSLTYIVRHIHVRGRTINIANWIVNLGLLARMAINHVYYEGNKYADLLANEGFNKIEGLIVFSSIPTYISFQIFEDVRGAFYPRFVTAWFLSYFNEMLLRASLMDSLKRAEEWGMPPNQMCNNETDPISKEGHWGIDSDLRMMQLVEAAIDELKARGLKVQMLNITQLSEYRKDAHPSIYRKIWGSKEEQSNPTRYADCMHWCLPGVPDVWNLLLYAYIFHY